MHRGTETDFQTERGKESSNHKIRVLNDHLYSPSLLRLWQTGADELAYEAAEDECKSVIHAHILI